MSQALLASTSPETPRNQSFMPVPLEPTGYLHNREEADRCMAESEKNGSFKSIKAQGRYNSLRLLTFSYVQRLKGG